MLQDDKEERLNGWYTNIPGRILLLSGSEALVIPRENTSRSVMCRFVLHVPLRDLVTRTSGPVKCCSIGKGRDGSLRVGECRVIRYYREGKRL